MTWNEFKNDIDLETIYPDPLEKTDIQCPVCGQYIYRRNDIVLTSNPPKRQYECRCGWVGYAFK